MVRKGEGRVEQGCGKAMRKEWDGKKYSCSTRSVGQDIVGHGVTGAISLGHSVLGQDVNGTQHLMARSHWGKIPVAGRQWGRRFRGRKRESRTWH